MLLQEGDKAQLYTHMCACLGQNDLLFDRYLYCRAHNSNYKGIIVCFWLPNSNQALTSLGLWVTQKENMVSTEELKSKYESFKELEDDFM